MPRRCPVEGSLVDRVGEEGDLPHFPKGVRRGCVICPTVSFYARCVRPLKRVAVKDARRCAGFWAAGDNETDRA